MHNKYLSDHYSAVTFKSKIQDGFCPLFLSSLPTLEAKRAGNMESGPNTVGTKNKIEELPPSLLSMIP